MKIHFPVSILNQSLCSIKDKVLNVLTTHQQKVAAVALVVFSPLAIAYLLYRLCFKASRIDPQNNEILPPLIPHDPIYVPTETDTNSYKAAEELNLLSQQEVISTEEGFNSIFFTANELGASHVLNILKTHPFKENHCHIGVSGLFNWSIAVAAKAEMLVMVDINPKMIEFNQLARDVLIRANDGHDFASSLAKYCMQTKNFKYSNYRGRNCHADGTSVDETTHADKKRSKDNDQWFIELFENAFNGPYSVFQEEGSFQYLQKMVREGKIIVLHGNLTDVSTIKKVGDTLKNHQLIFGTVYLSNAYEWINKFNPKNNIAFLASLSELTNPDTLIIEGLASPYKKDNFYDIQLNIFYSKDPVSAISYHPNHVRNINEEGLFEKDQQWRKGKYPSAPLLVELGQTND